MGEYKYITTDSRSKVKPYRVRVYDKSLGRLKYVGRFETVERAIEARDKYIQKSLILSDQEEDVVSPDLKNYLKTDSLKTTEIPW